MFFSFVIRSASQLHVPTAPFVCLRHLQASSFPGCHLHLPSLSRSYIPSCLKFRNFVQKTLRTLLIESNLCISVTLFFFEPSRFQKFSCLFFFFFVLNHKSWNRFFFFLHLIPVRNFLVLERQ